MSNLESNEDIVELLVVHTTEASERIPALGSIETLIAAHLRGGAVVLTTGDVIGEGDTVLVDGRVEEAQRRLAGSQAVSVHKCDHTSHHRGGGGGTGHLVCISTHDHFVVEASHGDIRVTTTSGDIAGHGLLGLTEAGEVRGHSGGLVRGSVEDSGETATSGDSTALVGSAGNLSGATLGTLGGTHSGDIGRGGGEGRVVATLLGVGACLEIGHTIITRAHKDTHTLHAQLHGLSVEGVGNRSRQLILDGTVRNGVDQRRSIAGSHCLDPGKEGVCGVLIPVGGGSHLRHRHDVLDVQIGLNAVVGVIHALAVRHIASDIHRDLLLGKIVGFLELGEISGRVVLAQRLKQTLRTQVVALIGSNIVIRVQHSGGNGTRLLRSTSLESAESLCGHTRRKLSGVKHGGDVVGQLRRNRIVSGTNHRLHGILYVIKCVECCGKHLFP
mmetsp:Transcript_33366/g.84290  ORF Transcript_33366/g.84290 Transcript_33366/m.84290 type:complete len:443 (+) Transcript_33366:2-1330(+)